MIFTRKCISECRLQAVGHFVPVLGYGEKNTLQWFTSHFKRDGWTPTSSGSALIWCSRTCRVDFYFILDQPHSNLDNLTTEWDLIIIIIVTTLVSIIMMCCCYHHHHRRHHSTMIVVIIIIIIIIIIISIYGLISFWCFLGVGVELYFDVFFLLVSNSCQINSRIVAGLEALP